jgi:hypothetical protein
MFSTSVRAEEMPFTQIERNRRQSVIKYGFHFIALRYVPNILFNHHVALDFEHLTLDF